MSVDPVPEMIRAAGDDAVRAYREFLDDPVRSDTTRKVYGQHIRRFFRWAQSRGLTLETMSANDIAAYMGELVASTRSQHAATIYLTPVRGLFRRFVSAGVLAQNPCAQSESRLPPAKTNPGAGCTGDRRFPLLALMAILANMEEKSMEAVFGDHVTARKLLEFARWRDERTCTQCSAVANEQADAAEPGGVCYCCSACGCTYAVTDGSLFDGLTVPLQHALFLLFSFYLRDAPPPEAEALACDRGLSGSDVMAVGLRVEEALARDGLRAGEELRQAVVRKNREMTQEEVARDIIEYGQLEAAHKELVQAKAEGHSVDDLPPGMTLDAALADIEARIAEHDRWVISLEDGYLVRQLAEDVEKQSGDQDAGTVVASDGR